MKRLLLAVIMMLMVASACNEAPEPGDIAAFCSLLESGTGLTSSPTAADLERLALVAPPAVSPTIDALQSRARDFSELLAESPPDLEALFNARFDPQATSEQAALDNYALNSCGIAADRPAPTRWNTYVRDNHGDAIWASLVTAQFVVTSDRIDTATMVFNEDPASMSMVEDVCRALSAFLVADGADPGRIQVFIGPVIALEQDTPAGPCRLP